MAEDERGGAIVDELAGGDEADEVPDDGEGGGVDLQEGEEADG